MTREDGEPLTIGEVRYEVFTDPETQIPWLCQLRLVSLTPKGRKARWEAIGALDSSRPHVTDTRRHPEASAIEAVERFQRRCLGVRLFDHEPPGESIRKILLAERIKERLLEKANTVPIQVAASTG